MFSGPRRSASCSTRRCSCALDGGSPRTGLSLRRAAHGSRGCGERRVTTRGAARAAARQRSRRGVARASGSPIWAAALLRRSCWCWLSTPAMPHGHHTAATEYSRRARESHSVVARRGSAAAPCCLGRSGGGRELRSKGAAPATCAGAGARNSSPPAPDRSTEPARAGAACAAGRGRA